MNVSTDDRRRWLILAICCTSMFLVVLDISVVSVALPSIARDLHASMSSLQWTIDAYTVVLAGFLVLAGSAADRYGRRRTFQTGLAVFALGSLLCGLAPTTGLLIAARVVQALGGTMLNPVALAIVVTTFTEPAERARAIGVFGSISGLSLALGPIIGGVLVDTFGWSSVFLVNVPVAIAAIGCAARFVPESRAPRARRFDPIGQVLVTLLMGCLVYAITESRTLGWTSPAMVGLLTVVVLSVIGLAVHEPRRADPLLELRLFRSVPFSSALVTAMFGLCGFGSFLFLTTQYLQGVRGLSAAGAGLMLLPVGALIAVLSPMTGRVVGAGGPRLPLVVSGCALAAGGAASLALTPDTPLPAVAGIYLLFGLALATLNPPVTNTAITGMPRSMAGLAGSIVSVGRQAGTTLGVAISGTVVGSTAGNGSASFTEAEHGVWWILLVLGVGIVLLGISSTGRRAAATATRAAEVFRHLDDPRPRTPARRTGSSAP